MLDNISYITDKTFSRCNNLTSVYCKPLTPPSIDAYSDVFEYATTTIYVPAESEEEYKTSYDWERYASQIKGYDYK